MGELIDYICKTTEPVDEDYRNLSLLPVVIGYDGNDAYGIASHLNSNDIDAKQVHTSYGKHSDNIGSDNKINNLESFELYCPILLVYSLENVDPKDIKEIYPFSIEDFKNESVYDDIPELEYFSLGNQVENILKYIECFFGTNEAYLYGQLRQVEKRNIVTRAIGSLYTKSLNAKVKTIYVDIKNFQLIDENLKCIILPERLEVFEEFETLTSRFGIVVKEYKTNTTFHPAWYNYEVAKLLEEYLRETGKL